jgi:hypothetical protein
MADNYSNMIRDRATGNVYTQQEWLALYPDVSFPLPLTIEIINEFGADAVLNGPQAVPTDIYHYSQYNGVVEQDGIWYTSYILGPIGLSPEEWDAWVIQTDDKYKASNKEQAKSLLAATDWVDIPAVSDPANIPHLANKDEFNTYRLALRSIAVTPPVTVDPWPVKPEEVWVTE